jgi:hypothetical protein
MACGWIRVKIRLPVFLCNHIRNDDQNHSQRHEQEESDSHVFAGSFVVLIWIYVLVPLKVFIKYYSVPKPKPNYHLVCPIKAMPRSH